MHLAMLFWIIGKICVLMMGRKMEGNKSSQKNNPLVFLDICIDGDPAERMVFELFSDVPKTAENFRALCTGEKGIESKTGRPLHYKGSFFHLIVKGSMAKAGDFVNRDGSGGESIYPGKFPEELPWLKHDEPGLLSMAIDDRNSRGSQFILTFKANHHLDRKCVVFGKLVKGKGVLKKIESVGDEEGNPIVTVKITNSGEFTPGKRKTRRLKIDNDVFDDTNNHELRRRRGRPKKSSRKKMKRRKYYTSESDSSSDTETESSESDSDFDSSDSSSDVSSSSDDRRRKRKRSSMRDKRRHIKKRDKLREKNRKRHDKRSKRRSKKVSDTDTQSKSTSGSSSGHIDNHRQLSNLKPGNSSQTSAGNLSPLVDEKQGALIKPRRDEVTNVLDQEEGELPKENGLQRSNGIKAVNSADKQPDVLVDRPGKSRSYSMSPKRAMSKNISPRRSLSRSPSEGSKNSLQRSMNRSPSRSDSSKSPARSVSQSPPRGRKRSTSLVKAVSQKSDGDSPLRSVPQRSPSRSPLRILSQRSVSKSPVRAAKRSVSHSPVRSSRRSLSKSSGKAASRRGSRSPARVPSRNYRHSYSKTPSPSPRRRLRSPDRGRSLSRSSSPDESSKRIRRGRGFSHRYSYARRYRTRSPERSPVRPSRYGGRGDRDRYSSYRRYSDRSPRRYRSPPRGRSPPRYRSRRSRTRSGSLSGSPVRHRPRRYSPSPIETSRYRASPRPARLRSPSRSGSPSLEPRSLKRGGSRSSSGKGGLVSYDDGSPDSAQK